MNSVPSNEIVQTAAERAAELQEAADTLQGIGNSANNLAPSVKSRVADTLNGTTSEDQVDPAMTVEELLQKEVITTDGRRAQ